MRWPFKRREEAPKEAGPIVLSKHEQELFEKMQGRPFPLKKEFRVVQVSRDRQLEGEDCFTMPEGDKICSIASLKEYALRTTQGDFLWLKISQSEGLKKWVFDKFEQPVFAEQLVSAKSKEEFLSYLDQFLSPQREIEVREVEDEKFNKGLVELLHKFDVVKDSVRGARKKGVDTFVSQTKLMNIKSKIAFAELNRDQLGLSQISAILDDVMAELETEKKKEESVNARRAEA